MNCGSATAVAVFDLPLQLFLRRGEIHGDTTITIVASAVMTMVQIMRLRLQVNDTGDPLDFKIDEARNRGDQWNHDQAKRPSIASASISFNAMPITIPSHVPKPTRVACPMPAASSPRPCSNSPRERANKWPDEQSNRAQEESGERSDDRADQCEPAGADAPRSHRRSPEIDAKRQGRQHPEDDQRRHADLLESTGPRGQ